jgi:hypothetical protein
VLEREEKNSPAPEK